jgi:hypothetical protein
MQLTPPPLDYKPCGWISPSTNKDVDVVVTITETAASQTSHNKIKYATYLRVTPCSWISPSNSTYVDVLLRLVTLNSMWPHIYMLNRMVGSLPVILT